jgi:CheY-like chemotaxis protein
MLRSASSSITVQFTVKDSGIGIAKPKQKQIFESFTQADANTTRKYGGTGLGLAISKKLVEMLGGELMLQSEVNLGSIFHFTLDVKTSNTRKAYINADTNRKLESLRGIRILIAEDNPVNMAVAKRFLQKWDIDVKEACNGLEAVELFKEHKFDLVLLDLEMPEMDGPSAVIEIKKLNAAIPALAFTAAVYDNMYEDLRSKGFNDFIRKPFRPEDLHRKITEFVQVVK